MSQTPLSPDPKRTASSGTGRPTATRPSRPCGRLGDVAAARVGARVLGDVAGKDVLELGCGAAQWSILLAQAAARASSGSTTRRGSSSTRASTWPRPASTSRSSTRAPRRCRCRTRASTSSSATTARMTFGDPYRTVPEAARLLRPGGLLAFSHSTPLAMALRTTRATAGTPRLVRAYFGHAPLRRAAGRARRVQPPVRRVDPALPRARLPRRGAGRGAAAGGRGVDLPRRAEETAWARLVADGGDLASAGREPDRRTRARTARRGRRRPRTTSPSARAELGGRRRSRGAILARARERAASAARRRRRQGRRRARLRHGLRLGVARPPRRARPVGVDLTRRAARDGAARCRPSTGSTSRSSTRAPRTCRCRTRRSTSPSRSTARSIWCDPDLWIAEAARLLRPGGELVFLVNGTLLMLTAGRRAGRAAPAPSCCARTSACAASSGPRTTAIDFHLGYGDWIRLLTAHGFEVEGLIELRTRGTTRGRYDLFTRRVGRALARRGDVEGAQAGVSARRAAAPARLDLAAAARDPRAARAPVRGRRAATTRSTTRPTPTRSSSCASTRAGKARSVAAEAGGRPVLGVDTTVVCGGRVYGKAADAARRRRRCCARARRRDARGRLRPLPASPPEWEESSTRRRASPSAR